MRAWRWLWGPVGLVLAASCGGGDDAPATKHIDHPDASLIDSPADTPGDAPHDHELDGSPDVVTVPYDGPETLSKTGLYSDIAKKQLAAEVRPFDVRQETWMDGATAQRFILLPSGQKIDTTYMEVWKFPVGTKAWQEVSVGGKPVETRFLWKRDASETGWLMVSFQWNAAGDEAIAVPGGASAGEREIPSSEVCTQCHNGQGDGLIGFAALQLSRETGGGYLSTLISEGLLTDPPAAEFPAPGSGNDEQALLYLHANCGHCHSDEYWLSKIRVLRLKLLTTQKTPEETGLYTTAINAVMDHNLAGTTLGVVPGAPFKSQLFVRCGTRGFDGMPPFDSKKVDPTGMQILQDWILSLAPQ